MPTVPRTGRWSSPSTHRLSTASTPSAAQSGAFCYSAFKHSAGQPIVAGWHYQWICQLSWASDLWTAMLDAMRIAPFVRRDHLDDRLDD
ncbi:MAG: hypothetical protein ACP5P1_06615 [Acidimicrobiales bacterium]